MDKIKFNKALSFHQTNNLDKAISEYKKILKLCEKNESLYFYLGTAYLQKKHYINAEKYLNMALSINKDNFHALSNLGILHKEKNDPKKAILFFNRSLNINPNFEHAYNNIGTCLYDLNEFDEALENYEKAINLNPNPEFYFNKAKALEKIGNKIEALEILDEMDSKKIINLNGYKLFIKILKDLNNFLKIDTLFNKIKNQIYQDDSLLYAYIDNLLAIDAPKTALEFVKKIKDTYTNQFYRGLCKYKLGNFEESLSYFNNIKNIKENNNVTNNIGLIYKALGDFPNAKKYFSHVLNKDKNNKQANTNLGLIELLNCNYLKGFRHYQSREVLYDPRYFLILKRLQRYFELSNIKNKKIIVIPEQGIGDQILFYQILHCNIPKNFDFIVEKRLLGILQSNFNNIKFYTKDLLPNLNNYNGFIMLADLFGEIINNNFPNFINSFFRKVISSNFRNKKYNVGISWKSFNKENGASKSLNLENIIALIPQKNQASIVNLQYGDILNDIIDIEKKLNTKLIIPNIDYYNDLDSLIDIILSCSLVITTSNITAHLAGSYGKKTFLLCPRKISRHWYWHDNRQCKYYKNTSIYFLDFNNIESSDDYQILAEDIKEFLKDDV
jgi:tetratricopeptide (TPR) repeat protein